MAKKKQIELTIEEKLQNALVPKEEQPYKIPSNWCWSYWKYCGKFIAGNGFKNIYQGFTQYDIPYYKVGSLKFCDEGNYLIDETNTINEEIRTKLKAVKIPVNSIIFAKIGEAIKLNRRCLNKIECCIDNNLMAFISEKYFYKYIFYWTKSLNFYELTNATTVPALRKTDLENIPIPLPPLNEQQRIVNRIESLFAKLDRAKELIENTLAQFEQNKMAILHKTFTGELTAKWRKENNIDLSSWEKIKLGKVLLPMQTKKPTGQFFRYIDIDAIDNKRQIVKAPKLILTEKAPSRASRGVETGNILFSMVRPYLKNIAQIDSDLSDCIASTGFYVCRCKPELNSRFLYYLFIFDKTIDYLMQFMKGDNSPSIRKDDLLNMKIDLPTIEEQQEIVNILDNLLAKYNKIKNLEQQLEKIELLKKAILAKAFRGELGTNNPDEESAENLLKEILAEK
ncbi:restriction endonuclease subunit S [Megamonas funiformis]|uniref:restriction endonuclease subunit S n=1 Tax=Megamonas funiformis TaxID=437897 RepID=UPI0026DA929E|nr:restriction endonuclease subunit S [Megamonas funiformis]